MARKTREDRLLDALEDAVADSRFSKHLFAQHASTSVHRKEIFHLCSAFIEMLAISGDYGDFTDHDVDEVLLSRRLRNIIQKTVANRD